VKESKRQLSESELIELVQRQGGVCHDCGCDIGTAKGVPFHAHHVIEHSKGGQTDLTNEVAVCVDCHGVRHDKQIYPQVAEFKSWCDPRFWWQVRGLFKAAQKLRDGQSLIFAEVVTGAGKTLFATTVASMCRQKRNTDSTIIVVPKNCNGDDFADEIRAFDPSASISRQFLPSAGRVFDPPAEDYIIITYQALTGRNHQAILKAVRQWKKQGWSCCCIFDEIHHTSDSTTWGNVKNLESEASLSLVLTATPFRQDEAKIAILPYGLMGVPIPDISYTMREAIRDRSCRTVSFRFVDVTTPIMWLEKQDGKLVERHADRLCDVPKDRQASVARRLLMPDRALWTPIYQHGVETLKDFRAAEVTSMAKGLIVCEAGKDKDCNEVQWIERTSNAWMRPGGSQQRPVVVTYDKPDSRDRIRHFKKDPMSQWIAAINMISEGVNIPWLMVLCLFRCVSSEMLFHQLVGRVMRTTLRGSDDEWGRIVLPRTSLHLEYAESLEDAVRRGISERPVQGASQVTTQHADAAGPRVIEAFADEAGLQGGATEGCQVPEQWVHWGRAVLRQRRRTGDEVRLGLYLGTAKEMNVYGGSADSRHSASRTQLMIHLQTEMRAFAKHINMAKEDSDVLVFQKLGMNRWSDIETFTDDDLCSARSVVRQMTVDAIRKAVAV